MRQHQAHLVAISGIVLLVQRNHRHSLRHTRACEFSCDLSRGRALRGASRRMRSYENSQAQDEVSDPRPLRRRRLRTSRRHCPWWRGSTGQIFSCASLASASSSACGRLLSSTCSLTASPKPPPSRGPIDDRAFDPRLAGVLLVLLADEIQRAAEAGGIARREQVLRRRRPRLARPAHRLGDRQVGADDAVGGLRCGRCVRRWRSRWQ